MRVTTVLGLVVLADVTGVAVAEQVYFTPDTAVHECLSEAALKVEERFGGPATAADDFEAAETEDGWRIDGSYLVEQDGVERRVMVTCRLTGQGTEVTTEPSDG